MISHHHSLVTLAAFAALGSAASAGAAPPSAKPPPLPEPVTERHFSPQGRISIETYRLDPATAPVPPPTVAQRRYLAHRLGKRADKPLDVVIACWIKPSGEVGGNCAPDNLDAYPQFDVFSVNFARAPRPVFPVFPELTERRPQPRRVEYRFHYDGAPLAPIDWDRGPLVDRRQIAPLARTDWVEYPIRAMAARKEAKVMIECQVQDDRSIICRTIEVAPPENASYFSDTGEYQYIARRAPATLADGGDSAGARARFELDFRLPD